MSTSVFFFGGGGKLCLGRSQEWNGLDEACATNLWGAMPKKQQLLRKCVGRNSTRVNGLKETESKRTPAAKGGWVVELVILARTRQADHTFTV